MSTQLSWSVWRVWDYWKQHLISSQLWRPCKPIPFRHHHYIWTELSPGKQSTPHNIPLLSTTNEATLSSLTQCHVLGLWDASDPIPPPTSYPLTQQTETLTLKPHSASTLWSRYWSQCTPLPQPITIDTASWWKLPPKQSIASPPPVNNVLFVNLPLHMRRAGYSTASTVHRKNI